MSNRERWIIYPLLTFALALGLKDRLVPTSQIRAGRIECADLITTSLRSENIQCNKLRADVVGKAHWIDAERLEATLLQVEQIECSRLIASGDDDQPQFVIRSTPKGGVLIAKDAQGNPLGAMHVPSGTVLQQPNEDAPPSAENGDRDETAPPDEDERASPACANGE